MLSLTSFNAESVSLSMTAPTLCASLRSASRSSALVSISGFRSFALLPKISIAVVSRSTGFSIFRSASSVSAYTAFASRRLPFSSRVATPSFSNAFASELMAFSILVMLPVIVSRSTSSSPAMYLYSCSASVESPVVFSSVLISSAYSAAPLTASTNISPMSLIMSSVICRPFLISSLARFAFSTSPKIDVLSLVSASASPRSCTSPVVSLVCASSVFSPAFAFASCSFHLSVSSLFSPVACADFLTPSSSFSTSLRCASICLFSFSVTSVAAFSLSSAFLNAAAASFVSAVSVLVSCMMLLSSFLYSASPSMPIFGPIFTAIYIHLTPARAFLPVSVFSFS